MDETHTIDFTWGNFFRIFLKRDEENHICVFETLPNFASLTSNKNFVYWRKVNSIRYDATNRSYIFFTSLCFFNNVCVLVNYKKWNWIKNIQMNFYTLFLLVRFNFINFSFWLNQCRSLLFLPSLCVEVYET